ncbi:MAG: acyltransferase, partial [Acetobacteraceae bacterium]|nr:acyltransferase [Acetobacteraceae bacterium]
MKLRGLELMRGIAALSVAMAHSDSAIGNIAALGLGRWHSWELPGSPGVEFFFVLSGFVMGLMHAGEIGPGGRPLAFLWRRACRIYPLYLFLLLFPLWRYWGAPIVTAPHIAAWASLLPIRTDNLIVVAWTLRQELVFYAVFALCLLPRIGRAVLLAWIVATVGWCLLGWQADLPRLMGIVVNHLLSPFNFEFCAGLLAAVLFRRIRGDTSLALVLVLAGVATIGWRMGLDGWGVDYGPAAARLVYGAGYASVLLGLSMLERSGTVPFRGRWGRFAVAAGAVSYPLYLCHLLVIDVLADRLVAAGLAPWLGANAVFALFLGISVLVATGLAYLVDRPIQ